MKIKLSDTIEIDESKFPNLTKSEMRAQVQGIFDSYMQALEEEAKNLLADLNIKR